MQIFHALDDDVGKSVDNAAEISVEGSEGRSWYMLCKMPDFIVQQQRLRKQLLSRAI